MVGDVGEASRPSSAGSTSRQASGSKVSETCASGGHGERRPRAAHPGEAGAVMRPDLRRPPAGPRDVHVVALPAAAPVPRPRPSARPCCVRGPGRAGGSSRPFAEYDDAEASRWLAACLEAAHAGPPAPLRDTRRGQRHRARPSRPTTSRPSWRASPAARRPRSRSPSRGRRSPTTSTGSPRCGTRSAPAVAVRVDANGAWDVEQAARRAHRPRLSTRLRLRRAARRRGGRPRPAAGPAGRRRRGRRARRRRVGPPGRGPARGRAGRRRRRRRGQGRAPGRRPAPAGGRRRSCASGTASTLTVSLGPRHLRRAVSAGSPPRRRCPGTGARRGPGHRGAARRATSRPPPCCRSTATSPSGPVVPDPDLLARHAAGARSGRRGGGTGWSAATRCCGTARYGARATRATVQAQPRQERA